jgi:hypothetical protein
MAQSPDTPPPKSNSHDQAYNRDQDQKAGSARMAQEPAGSEGSARSPKTATDPASGEHHHDGPAPNQAKSDQTDGVKAPKA